MDGLNIISSALFDLSGIVKFLLGAIGTLGLTKYYLEPRQAASALRVKYGTALWITCHELEVHLSEIHKKVRNPDNRVFYSLLKIPRYDWRGRPDWFTKEGFYTMVTAYRIASLAAWLYIYRQELLFSRTRASSKLLAKLYNHTSNIRTAFSENGSCLWPEYFDAVGSQIVERFGDGYRPFAFSAFCLRYAEDKLFLQFYDQLHMFIHLTAQDEHSSSSNKNRLEKINNMLQNLCNFLDSQGLLVGLNKDLLGREIKNRSVEDFTYAEE